MSLEDRMQDLERCTRCSYCKFVPFIKQDKKEYETVCPSIARFLFHSYSCGGRQISAIALFEGRIDYSDEFLDSVYKCQMDGACDVSCKNQYDREPYENMLELRARCVEDGEILPAHMLLIDNLKKEDNMVLAKKADRGHWANRLEVKDLSKEKADILFHAGCRYSYDEDLWPIVRGGVKLLKKAGVDLGIMKGEETCCGGRAYEMGYQGELTKFAEHNTENWKSKGIKTIVTACSDCYQVFKVLYNKIGLYGDVEILHITEYLAGLIKKGKLTLTREVPMTVTYHDPCHLGRLSEPWIHWDGLETKLTEGLAGLVIQEPKKEFRRGSKGVYDIPREIIKSIPGIRFVEMDRIREYAWCCGAGGGVLEAYPDFALWTGNERLKEAEDSGAEAIVTACGWCERNFRDANKENDRPLKILDIIELLEKAI